VKQLQNETENRKVDHIDISLHENVKSRNITADFENVRFVHRALPEINRDKIKLKTKVFGHQFSAPIFVGAMTGGTRRAVKINANIAKAVQELGLGMGLGSQRAAIENSRLESTYRIARKNAPTAFLMANIGAAQLVQGYKVKEVMSAIDMIEADAVAIHLNPLQEAIQLEGEAKYSGVIKAVERLTRAIDIPIIVKETGAGISAEVARKLENAGVKGIDVSGAGGTSWAAVEYYRAKKAKDRFHQRLGESFWDWGLSTVVSLVEVCQSTHLRVIASGGVRSGTDTAKSLARGANLASMTTPLLSPATKSANEVKKTLNFVIEELRNTMFLVGAGNVADLSTVPIVLMGKPAEWLRNRGFKPEMFARR
jgi:isopentenyl-diphosphate delta-isomerase